MDGVANQAMKRKGRHGEVPRTGTDAEAFGTEGKMAGIGAAAAMTTALRRLGQVCLAVRAKFRLAMRQRRSAEGTERRSA